MTYFTILTAYIPRLLAVKNNTWSWLAVLFIFLNPSYLSAEAITPNTRLSFSPRPWTLPGELTAEEQAQRILDTLKPTLTPAGDPTDADSSSTPIDSIVTTVEPKPSIALPTSPVNPVAPNVVSEKDTFKALEKVEPVPISAAYQQKYSELKTQWKIQVSGKSLASSYAIFFQQDDFLKKSSPSTTTSSNDYEQPLYESAAYESAAALSSGNLTGQALQALMLRYLSDQANIDIPINSINVASAFISKTSDTPLRVDDASLKSIVLDPATNAFTKKDKSVYASILRLGGDEGKGQYIIVVVDKHGNVSLIDPAVKEKAYGSKLLTAIVASINKQRTAANTPAFVPAEKDSIVYTGLQGTDSDNTRSGFYAFAYWAAFMKTNRLDAYKSINGAASEKTSVLDSYDSINKCAEYPKQLAKTTALHDLNAYELDLREWLRSQITFQ